MSKLKLNIPFPIAINISWRFGSSMKKKGTKKKAVDLGIKGTSKKEYTLYDLPAEDWTYWFGQWLVASMVMEAWKNTGKLPKGFKVPKNAVKDQADGSGLVEFEARY